MYEGRITRGFLECITAFPCKSGKRQETSQHLEFVYQSHASKLLKKTSSRHFRYKLCKDLKPNILLLLTHAAHPFTSKHGIVGRTVRAITSF